MLDEMDVKILRILQEDCTRPVADIGKMTLSQLLGLPAPAVLGMVAVVAIGVFALVHKLETSRRKD